MIEQIKSKWYDVELCRSLAREYYQLACQNPCRHTRGRAGWELLKVNQVKATYQRQYVELCDKAVSKEELNRFLQSQSINLYIP